MLGIGPSMEPAVPQLPDGWSLRLEHGPSDAGQVGSARDGVVRIWVDQLSNPAQLRWVLLHEIGHAWDLAALSDTDRQRWAQERGAPADADWWYGVPTAVRAWSDIPSEDFAEAFAYCYGSDHWASTLADPPTPRQCIMLRAMIGQ